MASKEDFERAILLLKDKYRHELRDHAFGDREIWWTTIPDPNGQEVADGYIAGINNASVGVQLNAPHIGGEDQDWTSFAGEQALYLSSLGIRCSVSRNDETGPERYEDGACMPGLTLEGVRKELCERPDDDAE